MRQRRWILALLVAVVAGAGGALDDATGEPGGSGEPAPGGGFPSQEKLEELRKTPLPEGSLESSVAAVDSWELEGPFPNVAAATPYRDPTDWGGLLDTAAGRRAGLVVPTEAMHCAAREWGRFYLEHRAPAVPELVSWMEARCATSTPWVDYHHFEGGIPADSSEADVFEAWGSVVAGLLEEHLVGGAQVAGIWYGRKDKRAIAVVAVGKRLLQIAPLSVIPDEDGVFLFQGETLRQAESLSVWVNRGRFGAERCEQSTTVVLPRFLFRCRTDPKDRESWLSVTLTEPGRLLGDGALQLVLFPSGEPHAKWERPSLGDPVPVGPDTDVAAEMTRLVNQVREEAGLEPLELSPAQSRVASELAPYFFASAWGHGPPGTTDLVVLGLMAGWSVEGTVQSGDFTSSFVIRSLDVGHLIAKALARPSGRRALLSPDTDTLAVGALVNADSKFLAGLYGTYALFQESAHDEYARQVLVALDAARATSGKSRARILTQVASLGRFAASRVQGDEEPAEVLNDLLKQSSRVLGRSVNGWFVETRDLTQIPFPKELLEREPVEVAIGVSYRKPEGDEPWGRYVVLLVAAGPAGRGA